MNQAAEDSITAMLNCFPQTGQDYALLLGTLQHLCDGLTDQAVIDAAKRFAAGDVKDQSKKFAPSAPEFVEEARRRDELLKVMARPRLPPPDQYRPGPLPPYQLATQRKWAENADRQVMFSDVSFEQWKALSATKDIPAGAKWVAAIGVVFGPAPKPQQ